jgi:hypothetical protein
MSVSNTRISAEPMESIPVMSRLSWSLVRVSGRGSVMAAHVARTVRHQNRIDAARGGKAVGRKYGSISIVAITGRSLRPF